MEPRLKGKVALVTGAAQGIGEGLALRFAREGCDVAVNDINEERLQDVVKKIEGMDRKGFACAGDVSDRPSVQRMVDSTLERLGKIDILVNNAGVVKAAHILNLEDEDWDLSLRVNLRGAYLCSKLVAEHMVERRSGTILNMSSKSGKQGGLWLTAYCTTKFGIIGFTQSLAMDLAQHGITVHALCPGIVFTPQWAQLEVAYGKKLGIPKEQVRDHYVKKIPMGRDATVEDVANVAVFLCTDEAKYMTGQAINITGGQEMR